MEKIKSFEDIVVLVDIFYTKVRQDDILGPIFESRVKDRWPEHLEKMYSFWQTILLDQHTYAGSPFEPHAKMPIRAEHFDRWTSLFHKTIDQLFEGEKALEAKEKAAQMAKMFNYKIEYLGKLDKDSNK